MVSPTGLNIRSDAMGDGHFGAIRDGGLRKHNGTDFVCIPGQDIFAPVAGFIARKAMPYAGEGYSGVLISNGLVEVKMFYFEPDPALLGCAIDQGQAIGRAQDISLKYGVKMKPHIHCQIKVDGHFIDPEAILYKEKKS